MGAGDTSPADPALAPLAAALDAIIARHARLAIAVSGGSDSVALMYLVAARGQSHPALFDTTTIVTVDHRLRPESASEAARVGDMARAAGFIRHVVLTWDGPHPTTGIQAAARNARYRLIGDHCRDNDIPALLTAHTRDDQAETVLMRLARGTGVDGLAGMAVERWLDPGVWHHRPLLDLSRAALRGHLGAIGVGWIDDPSNDNPAFERIRWRQARRALDALGLTDQALSLTASRAARAKAALDWAVGRAVQDAGPRYDWSPFGYAVLSKAWLVALPADIRVRLLGSLIEALGGEGTPPPLAALEAACDGLCNPSSPSRRGFTLHGAMVRVAGGKVTILREMIGARRGGAVPEHIAAHPIEPGETVTWDRRFAVALFDEAPEGATVGPLGSEGLAHLRAIGAVLPPGVPARVLWSLPVLTFATLRFAVPHLGIWPDGVAPGMVDFGPVRTPFQQRTKGEDAREE